MSLNLHTIRKDELIKMIQFRCEHKHNGLEHPACWAAQAKPVKVGFFDIETQGFDAGFGMMLSYALMEAGQGAVFTDVIKKQDMRKPGREDERIVKSAIKNLLRFDLIVTHYGNDYRFDMPFIRTRAVSMNIPFPEYGAFKHIDTFTILKRKFKLPRNRLETAARVLLGETEKNHVDPVIWRRAGRGDSEALGYVLDHNIRDVRELERVYNKIIGFVKERGVSV